MLAVDMSCGLNIEDQVSPGKGHDKIINTITPVRSGVWQLWSGSWTKYSEGVFAEEGLKKLKVLMSNQSLCLEQIGIQSIFSISEQTIRLWNGKDIIQDFGETEINSDLYSDYKNLSQLVLILELCPDCYNCVGLLDVGFPLFIQSGTYSTLTVNC